MTAEQVLRAIKHYELFVCPPTRSKAVHGAEWFARNYDGSLMGHGATPAEAVEAAVQVAELGDLL